MRQLPLAIVSIALSLASAGASFAQSEGLPPDGLAAPEIAADPDYRALGELFPEGLPSLLTPQSVARPYSLPAGIKPPEQQPLPTKVEYADGPMKVDVGTKVTTNKTVTPIVPPEMFNPKAVGGAAGGTGEVNGQVRYNLDKDWELYGTQKVGVVQADGTVPTMADTTTFGSLYKLPDWMAGGKIGASLELTPTAERKTRVEYRRPIGPAEGFVAAEQVYSPVQTDQRPPAAVRAGVNRKF
jgi:hypothetical protein